MSLDSAVDIQNYALDRADELIDGSSRYQTTVGNLLIEAWIQIWMSHPFLGLMAYPPQAQILPAAIVNATISCPAGVNVPAVLSLAPAVSVQNWWVLIQSSPTGQTYYARVTSHVANSVNCILDAVPEVLTNQVMTLAQMEITLAAGTGVFADGLWTSGGGVELEFIEIHNEEEVRASFAGLPQQSWPPEMAARLNMSVVRLSHWDIFPHRIEIPYYQEPVDPTGALTLPKYLRPALAEKTLALLYEAKGDARRTVADARYANWITEAKGYEHLLRVGLTTQGQRRRNPPY